MYNTCVFEETDLRPNDEEFRNMFGWIEENKTVFL